MLERFFHVAIHARDVERLRLLSSFFTCGLFLALLFLWYILYQFSCLALALPVLMYFAIFYGWLESLLERKNSVLAYYIPELLDWHYSVLGQYEQLSDAVLGKLESEMKSRLFSGVNERLESASEKIDGIFEDEFRSLISQKIREESQTVDDAARATYESLLNEAMQDSIQRFSSSVPAQL